MKFSLIKPTTIPNHSNYGSLTANGIYANAEKFEDATVIALTLPRKNYSNLNMDGKALDEWYKKNPQQEIDNKITRYSKPINYSAFSLHQTGESAEHEKFEKHHGYLYKYQYYLQKECHINLAHISIDYSAASLLNKSAQTFSCEAKPEHIELEWFKRYALANSIQPLYNTQLADAKAAVAYFKDLTEQNRSSAKVSPENLDIVFLSKEDFLKCSQYHSFRSNNWPQNDDYSSTKFDYAKKTKCKNDQELSAAIVQSVKVKNFVTFIKQIPAVKQAGIQVNVANIRKLQWERNKLVVDFDSNFEQLNTLVYHLKNHIQSKTANSNDNYFTTIYDCFRKQLTVNGASFVWISQQLDPTIKKLNDQIAEWQKELSPSCLTSAEEIQHKKAKIKAYETIRDKYQANHNINAAINEVCKDKATYGVLFHHRTKFGDWFDFFKPLRARTTLVECGLADQQIKELTQQFELKK